MDRATNADGLPHPDDLVAAANVGRAKTVLSIRSFRQLYTALVLSSFGDWLGFLATTALAAQLVQGFTAKAYATGGVLVFRLLPAVLFGPLAGAFADRFDRRHTMVFCDVSRFVLFVSIPLSHSLVYLLLASFLIESLSLFWIPAKEASVPNLVPRNRLESANQLSLIATYGSAPVAAAVFAALGLVSRELGSGVSFFSTRPTDLALYVDAATFLFSALTILRLDITSPKGERRSKENPDAPGFAASLREGLAFMRTEPLARGLLVGMLGALAAGGAIIAQGKLFAAILGGGDAAYGLLFGCIFLGIAAGVAIGPRFIGDLSRRRLFGPSIVGAGLSLAVMAVVPNLALVTVLTLLVGSFAGLAYVIGLTLLGGEVADELRGRTFGLVQSLMRIDLLLVTGTTPFISGSIGRHVVDVHGVSVTVNGVSVTLFVGGLLAIAVGVAAFRQMDDRRGVPLRSDLLSLLHRRPRRPSYSGLFIALEGGEGAGKSTQAGMLVSWLEASDREVVQTREPGATVVGAQIRALLLDPANKGLSPRTEALLYAADRAQHVSAVILPALQRGAVVVTDRYVDSSLAYQGAGRDLERDDVARLSRWATGGLVPDLTLLLDVDPVLGLGRISGAPDRIEQESLAFHQRVRQGFLDLAASDPDRYLVVAASEPPEVVGARVRERVAPLLPARTAGSVQPARP
ncbi:MAG: dTMP kinase [Actinomycetota bacterium]|nr:dTMP kinase [Actinomycetota bacterium]